jgi:hypothetical protein
VWFWQLRIELGVASAVPPALLSLLPPDPLQGLLHGGRHQHLKSRLAILRSRKRLRASAPKPDIPNLSQDSSGEGTLPPLGCSAIKVVILEAEDLKDREDVTQFEVEPTEQDALQSPRPYSQAALNLGHGKPRHPDGGAEHLAAAPNLVLYRVGGKHSPECTLNWAYPARFSSLCQRRSWVLPGVSSCDSSQLVGVTSRCFRPPASWSP